MTEIQFINKVWISEKGTLFEKVINICCWVYLFINIVMILMDGISASAVFTSVAALTFILWISVRFKHNGRYEGTPCKINFSEKEIIWEYPSIYIPAYKGNANLIYHIDKKNIKNISLRRDIQSVKVECAPLAECISGNKKKTIDYRKKNKSCVLITYNYDLEELKDLLLKYTGIEAEEID